jgi:hypothetical protein
MVPGRSDWIGGVGPYELDLWQPNTCIWRSAAFSAWDELPSLWVSAWTNPAAVSPRIPHDADGQTLLRASAVDCVDRLPLGSWLITTGAREAGAAIVVSDLVHHPDEAGGFALVFDSDNRHVDSVPIPGQPGSLVELDVTAVATTDQLEAALATAVSSGEEPVMLRLVGELAPRVLLPGFGGPDLPPEVVMNFDYLQYGQLMVEVGDRSAQAEFVRAMAVNGADALALHQTTALGLTALAETATGA